MKRLICYFAALVALTTLSTPAGAQVAFGIKGGLNLSKIDFKSNVKHNLNNKTGFSIGPMVDVSFFGLGGDIAIMYAQRGGTEEIYNTATGNYDEVEAKQQGIDIPLHLKYTFGLGRTFGIYIAAGPDFFFNFKDLDCAIKDALIAGDGVRHAQVGLDLGAGLNLAQHIQIGVNYQFGLGDSFNISHYNCNAKTNSWQVSLAYLF